VNELHAAGISDTVVSEREEDLRKRCAEEAEFMLKAACVEQEIATKEGLIVADEEIEQAKAELKESGIKGETVDEYFNAPDLRERYRWRMLRRKALDLVIEAARIKDVPVSDEDVSVQAPREQGGAAPETGQ
jgi:FKBP-type peptidyl-prolyl cis-trans isomerase (trigger factor)